MLHCGELLAGDHAVSIDVGLVEDGSSHLLRAEALRRLLARPLPPFQRGAAFDGGTGRSMVWGRVPARGGAFRAHKLEFRTRKGVVGTSAAGVRLRGATPGKCQYEINQNRITFGVGKSTGDGLRGVSPTLETGCRLPGPGGRACGISCSENDGKAGGAAVVLGGVALRRGGLLDLLGDFLLPVGTSESASCSK